MQTLLSIWMFEQVLSIGHLISEIPKVNKPMGVLTVVNSAANIILVGDQKLPLKHETFD